MSAPDSRKKRVEVEDIGDISVVRIVNKRIVDEQNIQMIGDDLFRLVDELGRHKILLDFTRQEVMSSAFLGKLIMLHRKLQVVKGKLVICGVHPEDILPTFKTTKLDKILNMTTDLQAGLRSFS